MVTKAGIWKQRLGYGVADFACNLIWQMITLYLMFFYTDVMGLQVLAVSALLLVTRIVDGVADAIMGIIIDKTRTRWGKSRPYFLFGAIPFGILGILTFYVPDIGPVGKLIYAYFTYMGLSLTYTMVNIPMASILPSLTRDGQERTVLATTRIIFSFIGATAVSVLTMPLVRMLGNRSQAHGFFWTMVIFSVVGMMLFFVTFKNVEEKVKLRQEKVTVAQTFSALKGNTPWYIFEANIIFMFGGMFFHQGSLIYYFTYYVNRPDLIGLVAGIVSLIPIIGTFVTPMLARRMCKRNLFQIASAVTVTGMLIMLISGTNIFGLIVGAIISVLGNGVRTAIYFSMQADPVDYGEWKSGISVAGFISSLNGFIGKVAMALAGAVSGVFLTWGNYAPNQTQSASGLFAIQLNYLIIPLILTVISMIIMYFYRLDHIFPQIRNDIQERNRAQDASEGENTSNVHGNKDILPQSV
ncbi:GPH family glycoside/pentoside/hexuronide:cation symporter [Paenibacillus sp. RC73]|uniref:glycoside-pentoside-hexuronide (GPH):cation symporter n=1 Tax=Paenibacillus sp. RC73 TaxID=3156250 RepID=UPI0038390ED7